MNPRRNSTLMPAVITAVAALTMASVVLAAGAPAKPAAKLKPIKFSMVVGHRAFTDFRDRVTVGLNETFRVGDSEYSARVVEFQPDFAMDLKSRKVISRSQEPNNPAAKVYVWKNGAIDDTSWAFLNMPPHFGRHSMLAFQLTRVEFENHAAVDAPKDTATATPKAGGHQP